MAKTRKRTGARKRFQQRRLGTRKPPDESKVRSPQTATVYWTELGRSELATGFTLRVSPAEDLAALPMINDACHKYARELAARMLTPALVAGIQPVAKQLDDIVSMAHLPEEHDGAAEPEQLVVAAAYKFAGVRRKAIARMAKGAKNLALRHSFGMHVPMRTGEIEDVRAACLALIAGRADHPGTTVAKMITADDVTKAKEFVARMNDIQSRNGAAKSSEAETARTRDVLHAAVELFYDRFGAAVNLALEDDDATRVALLSLIPRRKEARKQQQKPPAQTPLTGTK